MYPEELSSVFELKTTYRTMNVLDTRYARFLQEEVTGGCSVSTHEFSGFNFVQLAGVSGRLAGCLHLKVVQTRVVPTITAR